MAKTTEHKEGKATVRILYFTSKTLADGSHPFMVCITKDRQRKHIATGLSLFPKYWNDKHTGYREAIRRSYPEPNRNNLIIALEGWERKYRDAAETLAGNDEVHNAKEVATKALEGRKQARRSKLLAYIEELIYGMEKTGRVGNSLVYRDLKNQLVNFIKSADAPEQDDVRFAEVTVKFLNAFETHMSAKGVADTTLSNRFRTLRAVFNKAIGEGLAELKDYPFRRNVSDKHKFNVSKFDTSTRKRAISRDDVRKIETFVPTALATGPFSELRNAIEVERLQRAKDIFLFSFYVGGISFTDLASLRYQDLTTDSDGNTRLTYVRQKTGGKFSIRMLTPALSIVDRQRPLTYNGLDSYVFGILNRASHKTPTQIKNRLKKIIGQVNADLKTIGEQIGINAPLTTYVARHSFATSLRRAGVATGVISASMGHKTEAITAIYLDSFASETVDLAYDALL
ncbi:site-specific integrase [Spirosoma utsteinense]|uniref:Integrase n=1 Tax=Spirosoma utsteinense TaxID=2585773 RepID=A0ABR6WB76_9BACT|nr:site-specific integrase [Spirosoma utsteinense]MBC3786480.1 integrase [Spirosoma utsteinense]MBC3793807.1 integrase [Spirosoma utsteinense]